MPEDRLTVASRRWQIKIEPVTGQDHQVIASACTFCVQVFELGGKSLDLFEKGIKVKVIAEFVADELER